MSQADDATPPPDGVADAPKPEGVGSATMLADGTLELSLRGVAPDGSIGECLMVVAPADARYAEIHAHLGHLAPGESCEIPPFPVTADD